MVGVEFNTMTPLNRSNPSFRLQRVAFGSDSYHQTCALRQEILRIPLSMRLQPQDVAGEESQIHLAALSVQQQAPSLWGPVIGCVVLKPIDSATIKLRQMAVAANAQRGGVGTALVLKSLRIAGRGGFEQMVLDARLTAAGFYERLGFEPIDGTYEVIGLPHVLMTQPLPADGTRLGVIRR